MEPTLALLHHFHQTLPPVTPREILEAVEQAVADPEVNSKSPEALEETLVELGYLAWPWKEAYREFLERAEHSVGEHFLLPLLPPDFHDRYHDFKLYGGTLRDWYTGQASELFSPDERRWLAPALVQWRADLNRYALHQIRTLEQTKFADRVAALERDLLEAADLVDRLRALGGRSQEFPELVRDLYAHINAFEAGLAGLGPAVPAESLAALEEWFAGRAAELRRLRGIHRSVQIDWYADSI